MKHFVLFILFCFLSYAGSGQIYSYTSATSGAAASVATNATGTSLSRVNGATAPGTPCGSGYSSTSFSSTTTFTTSLQAVSVSAFPDAGYQLNISGFSVGIRRSNTGPALVRLAYSLDNGASWTDKGTNDVPNNAGCGSMATATWTPTGGITVTSSTLGIIFRIFCFNASGTTGTFQVMNLTINGTVTSSGTPPVIISHPVPLSLTEGNSGSFSAGATGAASYQWQRNTAGTTGGTWVNITGTYMDSTTMGSYGNYYTATTATTHTLSLVHVPMAWNGWGYRCVVTNSSGSTTTNAALLTVTPICSGTPVAGTIVSSVDTICGSGVASLSVTGSSLTGTPAYQWQSSADGTTWSSVSGATSATFTTGTLSATTHYRRIIRCVSNGLADTASTIVVVNSSPATISGPTSICTGVATAFTASAAGGSWSALPASIATVTSGGSVTGLVAGSSIVIYTYAGCADTAGVTVNSSPAAVSGAMSVCTGNIYTYSTTSTGGTWSSSAPSVLTVDATGTALAAGSGTATISYTFSTGCTATLSVASANPPAAITGAAVACIGVPAYYTTSSTGGTWSLSTSGAATISTSGTFTGLIVGAAVVSYTMPSGCYDTISLTINTSPATITGAAAFCVPATIALSNATISGVWSSSNPARATIGATGIVTAVSPGTTVISFSNTCGLATLSLPVGNMPAAITGDSTLCHGYTGMLANATSGGTWTTANASIVSISGTGITSAVSVGTVSITYNTGIGCNAYRSVSVIPSLPSSVTISRWPDTMVCEGTAITFTANPVNGGSAPVYQWSRFGAPIGTGSTFAYTPAIGDHVVCTMHSSAQCALPAISSDAVTVPVSPALTPIVTITVMPKDSVANLGQYLTFYTDLSYGGTAPTYQWYENSVAVSGATNTSYTAYIIGDVTVHCEVVSNVECADTNAAGSNKIVIHASYLGTDDVAIAGDISVTPNPAHGLFVVSGNIEGRCNIAVMDVSGKEVYNRDATASNGFLQHTIDIRGAAPGIYLLRISGKDNTVTRRLVIQ